MEEQLRALLPIIEQHASTLDAEYRSALARSSAADEEARDLCDRSRAADQLLATVREFLSGTYSEVPL